MFKSKEKYLNIFLRETGVYQYANSKILWLNINKYYNKYKNNMSIKVKAKW